MKINVIVDKINLKNALFLCCLEANSNSPYSAAISMLYIVYTALGAGRGYPVRMRSPAQIWRLQ
jgi:hypothetical protein